MHRQILEACAPWLAVLLLAVMALRLLAALSGARWRLEALRSLHRDEAGAVQSLSFVLTLPVFVMIMMLIVQVSQLMIATVVVHYAAFAAARAAVVWIPAETDVIDEGANRISSYAPDANAGIEGEGSPYTIAASGPKYQKIHLAAALACMPMAPSRDVGAELPAGGGTTLAALRDLLRSAAPELDQNPRMAQRLRSKLAYSMSNTHVKVSFLHPENEPPLADWDVLPEFDEFHYNELGWQDIVRVTVTHDLALLPGPGRLLARSATSSSADAVSRSIEDRGGVYVRSLTASVTLGNEGEKSVRPYRQYLY